MMISGVAILSFLTIGIAGSEIINLPQAKTKLDKLYTTSDCYKRIVLTNWVSLQ